MCTELYISYAFLIRIASLCIKSKLCIFRLMFEPFLINESFVVFNRCFSILMMNGSHAFSYRCFSIMMN